MVAIIPARGGSKGLPGKNIKLLNGLPLIAYAIKAAKESKYIDEVIVTTDSEEIAEVARKYGASVPFMRPDELSGDTSLAIDVYLHTTEFMKDTGCNVDSFMILLPTAPLRTSKHIDEAVELFERSGATTLISVKEAEIPVTWYMEKDEANHIHNAGFGLGDAVSNRQANTTYYIPNGAIYILNYQLLKEKRTYYCDNTVAYEMNAEESVDIDTMFDFELAEFLIKRNKTSC